MEKKELQNLEIKRGLRDMSTNHDMEISHKFLFTQILEMYIKIFTYKIQDLWEDQKFKC